MCKRSHGRLHLANAKRSCRREMKENGVGWWIQGADLPFYPMLRRAVLEKGKRWLSFCSFSGACLIRSQLYSLSLNPLGSSCVAWCPRVCLLIPSVLTTLLLHLSTTYLRTWSQSRRFSLFLQARLTCRHRKCKATALKDVGRT